MSTSEIKHGHDFTSEKVRTFQAEGVFERDDVHWLGFDVSLAPFFTFPLLYYSQLFQTWKHHHVYTSWRKLIIGWIFCYTGNNRAVAKILETLRSQVPNHKQNTIHLIRVWLPGNHALYKKKKQQQQAAGWGAICFELYANLNKPNTRCWLAGETSLICTWSTAETDLSAQGHNLIFCKMCLPAKPITVTEPSVTVMEKRCSISKISQESNSL